MSTLYVRYPSSSSSGIPTYANFAALPATATDGQAAITLDTDSIYVFNLGTLTWKLVGSPGLILSIGTIDSVSPSANGAVISSNALILQSASGTMPGLVNLTTQSFAGNKTFTGTIAASNFSGSSSGTNTGDVTIGTANGLSITGQALSLGTSSGSTTGALTSADWTTFNNKQDAGNYITALTGDGAASGPGSAALTLATVNASPGSFGDASHSLSATVNAKGLITSLAAQSIQIAESQVTNLVSDLAGKQPVGNYITALTSDVTASGPGSVAATIAANAVTNAKLAQMATNTIKGNNTAGVANAADLTVAQVNTLLGTVTSVAMTVPSFLSVSGSPISGGTGTLALSLSGTALPATSGGTGLNTYTTGDLLYSSATNTLSKLAKGNSGQYLQQGASIPSWVDLTPAAQPIATKTSNYTVLSTDGVLFGDSSGGTFTFTLPSAASNSGKIYYFKKIDSSTTAITIARAGSDTIDGATSTTLNTQYEWLEMVSDGGTAWQILDRRATFPPQQLSWTANNFGTTTNQKITSWRIGNLMRVQGIFTAGTSTANPASISLPSGYVIDNANLTSTQNKWIFGQGAIADNTSTTIYQGNNAFVLFYDGSDTAKVYFASASGAVSGIFNKANASGLNTGTNSGFSVCFTMDIPISGWN